MAVSTTRFASPLVALLLGCTALSGTAHAGWFDSDKTDASANKDRVIKSDTVRPAETLDGSIRQAQLLRVSGNYPEAIKHLSQLMMIASDDPRVISEYGKTLAAMGRAQDAVNFLTRAQQLQPGEWSNYSAMGVAYDQLGNQKDAQVAYERALTLNPNEPSALNNYALSRMLAKDPEGATKLIARAESAGGTSDPMIARNIAMIKDMTPPTSVAIAITPVRVAHTPQPQMAAQPTPQVLPLPPVAPKPQPQAVARNQAPTTPVAAGAPAAAGAPRPLVPANNHVIDVAPQAHAQTPRGVVMQAVPVDPLAGPVAKSHPVHVATKAIAKTPEPAAAPVKIANSQVEVLQAKADTIAKTPANKPDTIARAKAEANGKVDAAPATKPAAPATPVKVAAKTDTNPKVATAAKPRDAVPALRMSANAY
jgi:Flp pilus assembly protein TadD